MLRVPHPGKWSVGDAMTRHRQAPVVAMVWWRIQVCVRMRHSERGANIWSAGRLRTDNMDETQLRLVSCWIWSVYDDCLTAPE